MQGSAPSSYLDNNIHVKGENFAEHLTILDKVFMQIEDAKLKSIQKSLHAVQPNWNSWDFIPWWMCFSTQKSQSHFSYFKTQEHQRTPPFLKMHQLYQESQP